MQTCSLGLLPAEINCFHRQHFRNLILAGTLWKRQHLANASRRRSMSLVLLRLNGAGARSGWDKAPERRPLSAKQFKCFFMVSFPLCHRRYLKRVRSQPQLPIYFFFLLIREQLIATNKPIKIHGNAAPRKSLIIFHSSCKSLMLCCSSRQMGSLLFHFCLALATFFVMNRNNTTAFRTNIFGLLLFHEMF